MFKAGMEDEARKQISKGIQKEKQMALSGRPSALLGNRAEMELDEAVNKLGQSLLNSNKSL